ncbi:hypothetical protein SK128_005056, partial [Halocaridina rubra]
NINNKPEKWPAQKGQPSSPTVTVAKDTNNKQILPHLRTKIGKSSRPQMRIPPSINKSYPTCGPKREGPLTFKGEHKKKRTAFESNSNCSKGQLSSSTVTAAKNNLRVQQQKVRLRGRGIIV